MAEITRALIARVGVDLAKNVIQVHAIDAAGRRVMTRAFKRDQFLVWCAQLPPGLPRGNGGMLECASLRAQAAQPWGWVRG